MTERLEALKVWPQYLLPQRALTALAWWLSTCRAGWFKNAFIRLFIRLFGVDLNEAEKDQPRDYPCFNAFFTRALKPGARPDPPAASALISPCDGAISQLGRISSGRLIQAKDRDFLVGELLGDPALADDFANHRFITIYLAPRDYHRVHMPMAGRLIEEVRIPGRLFSVSAATARHIPRLFARNERLAAIFDGQHGRFAVVMVAAMLVAGIETVWGGPDDRRPGPAIRRRQPAGVDLERGAEMGRFHWGSTVIVLAPPALPDWQSGLSPEQRVQLFQPLA